MSRLPLLLALFAFALPAAAQERKIPWANKFFTGNAESPPPVILHDFGTLPKGTVKTYRFKMSNIYAVPMQVREPSPNCGCVSIVEYTGKMNPLETGHIDVKIDTSRVEGQKNVRIPVRFEARDAKTGEPFWCDAQLEVRAVSVSDLTMTPGSIEFGQVAAGKAAKQVVTIVYTGRQRNWTITDYGYRKELFDVSVVELKKGTFQVTTTLKPEAATGAFDEQIVLKTNDADPLTASLMLTARGSVQAPLSIAGSDLLKLGSVEVGKKIEKNVVVRSEKLFKISKVEGQGDGLVVTLLPVAAAKSQVVTVIFEPKEARQVKKTLTVITDAGEKVTLTVEGIGIAPQ